MKETERKEKWEEGGERGIQENEGFRRRNEDQRYATMQESYQQYTFKSLHTSLHTSIHSQIPSKTAHTENGLPHLPSRKHARNVHQLSVTVDW